MALSPDFDLIIQQWQIGPGRSAKFWTSCKAFSQETPIVANQGAGQDGFLPVVLSIDFRGGYIEFAVQPAQDRLDLRAFFF